ncbi:MAG: GntR family transcriptional regulator [Eubacteriales bacterium]|nr:GntR family transcriptional regulator [Eubacteriales bacterium]
MKERDTVDKMPKYAQIYKMLKRQITDGEYMIGSCLPPETELEKLFSVSRITVRKALEMLQREGFVQAQRGDGTRVLDFTTSQNLNSVTSISETLSSKGYRVAPKCIAIDFIETRPKLALEMGVEPGTIVTHIDRIQTADDKPVAIMNNYLYPEMVPNIEKHKNEIVRLYDFLEEAYDIVIDGAQEHIRAANATLSEAEQLKIPIGTALLSISRICFQGDKIVCVDHVKIIGDYYEYEVMIHGRHRSRGPAKAKI